MVFTDSMRTTPGFQMLLPSHSYRTSESLTMLYVDTSTHLIHASSTLPHNQQQLFQFHPQKERNTENERGRKGGAIFSVWLLKLISLPFSRPCFPEKMSLSTLQPSSFPLG